jgi:NADH:ubiquinone oxidoreductase subunit F (NADH-binding)/(2Fe-2S) ferredoxin
MAERTQILICGGTGCLSSKSNLIKDEFDKQLNELGIRDEVRLVLTGCFGLCEKGPVVVVYPDQTFYAHMEVKDVKEICEEHIYKGRVVERKVVQGAIEEDKIKQLEELAFYEPQERIALRNCGVIDPLQIDEYIARDGYIALATMLQDNTPQDVIDIMKESGLRGRGGGGFPTGLKWQFAANNDADQKYVICNADEGDPGAFMDRAILEGDPHAVIEAMILCGYAIGATEGYVYIRAEYPLAIERLRNAIAQAKEYGLLGQDIFGSGFDFDLRLKFGAGAFVCGEETALINSMEGNRGEPWTKPPFPAEKGYWGKPSNVNNVETYANVPTIIRNGAKWFRSFGTEKSPGTKVFSLAGKINNVGLIEVPMGTTLREVIYDIGGGIVGGKKFKAVQTGGPSGGCLTEEDLDTPIDFDSLVAKGSMMGSGGMIVLDEDDCMPAIAKFYLEFTQEESCGKCTPCRVGTRRLLELLENITEGKGDAYSIKELKRLSTVIKETSLCGLGQSAPNPVLSTLEKFEDEYVAHIKKKACPAHQCTDLIQVLIDPNECIGCTACKRACPVDCISGDVKKVHSINQLDCTKCKACFDACKFDAIVIR